MSEQVTHEPNVITVVDTYNKEIHDIERKKMALEAELADIKRKTEEAKHHLANAELKEKECLDNIEKCNIRIQNIIPIRDEIQDTLVKYQPLTPYLRAHKVHMKKHLDTKLHYSVGTVNMWREKNFLYGRCPNALNLKAEYEKLWKMLEARGLDDFHTINDLLNSLRTIDDDELMHQVYQTITAFNTWRLAGRD